MFSQETEQDPNEAIKIRYKERKICFKGKQQNSKRSDEISYRQNDRSNNLSAQSPNRKDKKSVHMYSRKRLTFSWVFVDQVKTKAFTCVLSFLNSQQPTVPFIHREEDTECCPLVRTPDFIYLFILLIDFQSLILPPLLSTPNPSSKEKRHPWTNPRPDYTARRKRVWLMDRWKVLHGTANTT